MANQIQAFSFNTMNSLYYACDQVTINKRTVRTLSQDIKKYVHTYFFQTVSNNYLFYDAKNDEFKTFTKQDISELYFSKFPEEVRQYFFHNNYKLYSTIMDTKKPKIGEEELNLFKGFIHPKKDYDTYPQEIKEAIDLFLSYVKEVISSKTTKYLNM